MNEIIQTWQRVIIHVYVKETCYVIHISQVALYILLNELFYFNLRMIQKSYEYVSRCKSTDNINIHDIKRG